MLYILVAYLSVPRRSLLQIFMRIVHVCEFLTLMFQNLVFFFLIQTYLDKVVDAQSPPSKTESRESIEFSGPVDSVYLNASGYVELDVGTGAAIAIASSHWSDVVVWNPWTAMEDCYKEFCCVENASFSNPVIVRPGESWRAQTEMSIKDL